MKRSSMGLVFWMLAAGFLAGFAGSAAKAAGQDEAATYPRILPFQDPSFESFQKGAGTSFGAWSSDGADAKLPPEPVEDACDGLQAASVKSGYVCQTVKLVPGDIGRYGTVSCQMKGTGTAHVHLTVQDKDNKRTKLGETRFPLCDKYAPCSFTPSWIPEAACTLTLFIGIPPDDKAKSKACVDKVSVVVEEKRDLALANADFESAEPGKESPIFGWKLAGDKKADAGSGA